MVIFTFLGFIWDVNFQFCIVQKAATKKTKKMIRTIVTEMIKHLSIVSFLILLV